ncbi:LamB/YcsF family protein [Sedimentibacter sp. MB31-C6]|uniref:LamB/YcsF family protein n=1 Tax=Sedimentibacter sp. MB31-C6 TaxID=3109366 RepID=UPI002DDC9552|nr:5-oxoprolinase subunit PxpA [Sedimentibacter sp. MB36-C1]WSI04756.1 5-oxoprolinase subunit PxpA [Sedimentibacter sp. MB36-C1]
MYQVDLNSDIGESFGNYNLGLDEEVAKYISSANIACGFHAGDPNVMEKTVKTAIRENVSIGAHPGYPDLMGFGRRNINVSANEIKNYIKYQIGALWAFAQSSGIKLQHVKPHGAMYNMAAKNKELAKAIAEGIYEVDSDLILVGLANSELIRAGLEVNLKVANEVFADRAYNTDGTLVPRGKEGAVIHDTDIAINRVIKMVKEEKVKTISGEEINIKADTICVHGDNPQAVDFVNNIKKTLENEGIQIVSMKNFILS